MNDMRCKYCGSTLVHPDTEHKTFSSGKAIAGAVTFGVVGAAAGFIGKDTKGYRCGACGAFMEAPMDFVTESSVDSAIRDAETGRSRSMFDYFKKQYPNIQANIPAPSATVSTGPAAAAYTEIAVPVPSANAEAAENEPAVTIKHAYKNNKWIPDCPIFIEEIIIKSTADGDVISLRASNQSQKTLRSVYFDVTVFDDTGDKIGDVSCVYQGLNVQPGEFLPEGKEFRLGTDIAYRVELYCEKTASADDEVWRGDKSETGIVIPVQPELTESNFPRLKYVRKQLPEYSRLDPEGVMYLPSQQDGYWQCICGHPVKDSASCICCGAEGIDKLNELLSQENLLAIQQDAVRKRAAERAKGTAELYERSLKEHYDKAKALEAMNNEEALNEAALIYGKISGYRDAEERIAACGRQKADLRIAEENAKMDAVYSEAASAQTANTVMSLEHAIELFSSLPGWRDSDARVETCKDLLEKAKTEEERKAEEKRASDRARAKKIKKIAIIVGLIAVAAILFYLFGLPAIKYNSATSKFENEQYDEAAEIFDELGDYKDSAEMAEKSRQYSEMVKAYEQGIALFESGDYDSAYEIFQSIPDYKESQTYLDKMTFSPYMIWLSTYKYRYDIEYDENGRIIKIAGDSASGMVIRYDENGKMSELSVGGSVYSIEYDGEEIIRKSADEKETKRYDKDGRILDITFTSDYSSRHSTFAYSGTDQVKVTETYEYTYDSGDPDNGTKEYAIEKVSDGSGRLTDFNYMNPKTNKYTTKYHINYSVILKDDKAPENQNDVIITIFLQEQAFK